MPEYVAEIKTTLTDEELDQALLDLAAGRFGGYLGLEKAVAGAAVEFEGEAAEIADPVLRAAAENAYKLVGEPLRKLEEELGKRFFGERLRKARAGEWWAPPKDWRELVARLIKKYFPEVEGTSKFLAYQGTLLGYLGPYYGGPKKALPAEWTGLKALVGKVEIPDLVKKQIEWAEEFAASLLRSERDGFAEGVQRVILNHLRGGDDKRGLVRRLGEEFGYRDRDWRRVAVTESAANYNNGRLMTLGNGTYVFAPPTKKPCAWCKTNLERTVFIKVDEPRADDRVEGDPHGAVAYVWPGKSNFGRSASPRARDGRTRTPDELWWATIPVHPNCVHTWVEFDPGVFRISEDTGDLEIIR